MGRSVTGIYLTTTEFGVSTVHWDWTDSSVGSKYEILASIEDTFVRRTDVSSPTFELTQFLFACVCFHYNHLDTHIHKNHRLRASTIFIAAGRAKHLHKFALTRYPWTRTNYTPYLTGIPPHVMLMFGYRINEGYFWTADKRIPFSKLEMNLTRVIFVGIYTNLDALLTK